MCIAFDKRLFNYMSGVNDLIIPPCDSVFLTFQLVNIIGAAKCGVSTINTRSLQLYLQIQIRTIESTTITGYDTIDAV